MSNYAHHYGPTSSSNLQNTTATSTSSNSSRFSEYINSIPLATKTILFICLLIYIFDFLFETQTMRYTISAGHIIYMNQWYRLITSPFFHGGLFHIGMNMMSYLAIGRWLEVKTGTLKCCYILMWSILLSNFLYVIICYLIACITSDYSWLFYQSIGFSGVLFTIAVIETTINSEINPTRTIFCFQVPTIYYPYVLLILLQVIMPNISFIGHLSGILVGLLITKFRVDEYILPSDAYLSELEASVSTNNDNNSSTSPRCCSIILARITRWNGYIACPISTTLPNENQQSGSICAPCLTGIRSMLETVLMYMYWALDVCIQVTRNLTNDILSTITGGRYDLSSFSTSASSSSPSVSTSSSSDGRSNTHTNTNGRLRNGYQSVVDEDMDSEVVTNERRTLNNTVDEDEAMYDDQYNMPPHKTTVVGTNNYQIDEGRTVEMVNLVEPSAPPPPPEDNQESYVIPIAIPIVSLSQNDDITNPIHTDYNNR